MTVIIILIAGLKFDGSLAHVWERRSDFISNIKMGGMRYSFSFASLKYYLSCITEPFAFLNIAGNTGMFAVLAFLCCGAFSRKKIRRSLLYCLLLGTGIEAFQYLTWFGAFDSSDIVLRFAGTAAGIMLYFAVFNRTGKNVRSGCPKAG